MIDQRLQQTLTDHVRTPGQVSQKNVYQFGRLRDKVRALKSKANLDEEILFGKISHL